MRNVASVPVKVSCIENGGMYVASVALFGQLFVHPSSSSIPACVAQSKAGRCCPLLQFCL